VQSILFARNLFAKMMDARVKPAHDDLESLLNLAPMGSSTADSGASCFRKISCSDESQAARLLVIQQVV